MTTEVIKTIRASGGDYTTLSAWEAALPASLVTADEQHTAVCYNDWPSGLNDPVTISGSTTDANRYIKVSVAAGHRHDGTTGHTGFYLKGDKGINDRFFKTAAAYTRLEWLDVEHTRNSNGSGAIESNQSYCSVTNCIGKCATTSLTAYGFAVAGVSNTESEWPIVANCLSINAQVGFRNQADASRLRAKYYNCVAIGCGTGFPGAATVPGTAINCVAHDCTTGFTTGWQAASGYNASTDTTATTIFSNSVSGIVDGDFVDATGGDYHLASSSALLDVGANLYSLFTDDIDGDIRPSSGAWSIGFDHRAAAAGSHDVAAENATSQPVASSAAITQTHPVAASNATSAPSASTAAISQTHNIVVASASSTPAASAAAITQTHLVGVVSATSQPIASGAQISQGSTHLVAGTNATSTPTASTAAIRQTHPVAGANAASAPVASTAAIRQTHPVAGTNAASAPAASTASVGQTHKVTAANATSTPVASAAAISQGAVHLVSASNASSQPAASAAAVAQSHRVAAANATSQPAASAAGIVQGAVHLIGAANSASQPSASAAAIGQTHAIAAMGSSIPSTASGATIKQIHLIDGTNATSIVTASGGAILIPGSEEAIPRESSTYRATERYTTYLSTRRLTTYPAARRPDAY